MNIWPVIICGLLGLLVCACVIPVVRHLARRYGSAHQRLFHQTHRESVSRLGGVGLASGFIALAGYVTFWAPAADSHSKTAVAVIITSLAMFGLGLWDDLHPLGAKRKLLGQIIIALGAYFLGLQIDMFKNPFTGLISPLGAWGGVVTVFWLVAFTNLVNLIDGIDGLAGGIALMLMLLLAFVGFHGGGFSVLFAAGMCGALLAFLYFNFPPAKIYMGDGGAYFLGFLIGELTIVNSQKGTVIAALVAPAFALALPIMDTTLAILRRGFNGLPIFRPDRRHIHHRLAEMGLSRQRTVLTLYAVSLVFLLLGFAVFWSQGRLLPILFGIFCLIFVLLVRAFGFLQDWSNLGQAFEAALERRKTNQYALTLSRWLELEAERCESANDLWTNFLFLAEKFGFTDLRVETAEGELTWTAPRRNGVVTTHFDTRYELNSENMVAIAFGCRSGATSRKTFEHLSELAAEAWMKATIRWQEVHGSRVLVRPVASEAGGPLIQPVAGSTVGR